MITTSLAGRRSRMSQRNNASPTALCQLYSRSKKVGMTGARTLHRNPNFNSKDSNTKGSPSAGMFLRIETAWSPSSIWCRPEREVREGNWKSKDGLQDSSYECRPGDLHSSTACRFLHPQTSLPYLESGIGTLPQRLEVTGTWPTFPCRCWCWPPNAFSTPFCPFVPARAVHMPRR